jgi:leucyl/phenylalanyl-tRNA--protein transferase
LVDRLRQGGFVLLDTQFATPHLAQFGVIEIPRKEYKRRLKAALQVPAQFN